MGPDHEAQVHAPDVGEARMTHHRTVRAGRALALVLPLASLAAPLAAQPVPDATPNPEATADGTSQEITVTARRRAESLLSVPIAVTAFTADRLAKTGAIDLTDLQTTTPNITLKDARGTNSTLAAFVRGVGQQDPVPGFEAGVGIYLDDVYLNRPQAAVLDIYDVDRIEILRGPQGTLYGRNTIGGAIKYVTRRLPDSFSLTARGTYGSFNEADGVVSVSAPFGDALKMGVSGARLSHDGFGRNLTNGLGNYNKDVWAGRGTVEFAPPGSGFTARITGDYTYDRSNPRNGHRLIPGLLSGTPVLANVYDTQAGLNSPTERVEGGGASVVLAYEASDRITLRSISAFRADTSYTPIDFDALPAADVDVPAVYRNEQTSQELQLLYKSERLNGIVGYYFLDARARTAFDVLLSTTIPGLDAFTRGDVRTSTHSVFADFTYDITPTLSLSAGGRYTWDRRGSAIFKANYLGGVTQDFGGNPTPLGAPATDFTGRATFKKFTPRVSLSFKPIPDQLVYASYSEGFKGGGFDPRGSGASAPISNPAAGRTSADIYNYLLFRPEIGPQLRDRVEGVAVRPPPDVRDRRLLRRLYRRPDPGSVGAVVNGIPTFIGITTNAAKARIKGAEAEVNAILARDFAGTGSQIFAQGTLGYIDAKYRSFIGPTGVDVSAVRVFQNTPEWTLSGTGGFGLPVAGGDLTGSATVSYRSLTHQFETASPFLDQPGYTLLDANLDYSFPGGRYTIGVHGKNLTDVRYKTAGYQYIASTLAGVPILNAAGGYTPTLGKEGIATAFYGNPRQVLATFTVRF